MLFLCKNMEYGLLLDYLNALAVNYLVFYLVTGFFRAETAVWRLLFAGGIYAAAETLGPYLDLDILLLKAILSVIGLLVSKEYFTIGEFVRFFALYAVIRLALIGAENFFYGVFGEDYEAFGTILSASVIACVILFKAATGLHDARKNRAIEPKVEILTGDKSYSCRGYVDTGNALYKDGKPVVVVSARLAEKLGLKSDDTLAVRTVSGIKDLPIAELSYKIYSDKKTHKLYSSYAVISDKMEVRGYDVLLHKDMLN